MDFASTQQYVDVCVDYALSYSEPRLCQAFHEALRRVSARPECLPFRGRPLIRMDRTHGEWIDLPQDIEKGLLFFVEKETRGWRPVTFSQYYMQFCEDMKTCYVPFRSLSNESFQDAMRLRVYQDSMNIIAGRNIRDSTNRRYSLWRKLARRLSGELQPSL